MPRGMESMYMGGQTQEHKWHKVLGFPKHGSTVKRPSAPYFPSLGVKVISYLLDYLLLLGNPNSCLGSLGTWEGERLRKESIGLLFKTWD